ncbi:MAG: hypothetical protein ACI8ZX_002548, partial [Planctomycetota bacterium]
MKFIKHLFITIIIFVISNKCFAQIPTYYNDVNLSLNGIALKNELATKIITTHSNTLSYSEIL